MHGADVFAMPILVAKERDPVCMILQQYLPWKVSLVVPRPSPPLGQRPRVQ